MSFVLCASQTSGEGLGNEGCPPYLHCPSARMLSPMASGRVLPAPPPCPSSLYKEFPGRLRGFCLNSCPHFPLATSGEMLSGLRAGRVGKGPGEADLHQEELNGKPFFLLLAWDLLPLLWPLGTPRDFTGAPGGRLV